MRKVYLYIILIGIVSFCVSPRMVKALSMECPGVVSQLEDITCKIKTDGSVGVKAKYVVDDIFNYLSFKSNSPWKNYYIGGLGFALGNVVDNNNLDGLVTFKVGAEAINGKYYSICLKDIEEVDKALKNLLLDDICNNIRIVSDVNTLSSLSIDGEKFSPKFSSNVINYKLTTKKDKIFIKASLTEISAKLEGDIGEKKLKYGVNTFVIKVTSERGNVREYKIFVTRLQKNNDITLKKLVINEREIMLDKDKYYYDLVFDNNVTSLDIEAIASDKFAKVEIDKPGELIIGDNVVSIKVIAEDGTEYVYVVNVIRKKQLSSNNLIEDLIIKDYDLYFSSNIYDYQLMIENERKLDIDVLLHDEFASYVISGNKDLKNNSKIVIKVTAENGDKRDYTITVFKEVESNSGSIMNSFKIVPLVGFVVLILIVLVVKKLKNKIIKDKNN